jgi:hypothetical protein
LLMEARRGLIKCNCGWEKCKGEVSRSAWYRHQLKLTLEGSDAPDEDASGAPRAMPVEATFAEDYMVTFCCLRSHSIDVTFCCAYTKAQTHTIYMSCRTMT